MISARHIDLDRALSQDQQSAMADATGGGVGIQPDDVDAFLNEVIAHDDAAKGNLSNLAQRFGGKPADWVPPPAGQPADPDIIAKLERAAFEPSRTGTLSIAIEGFPAFRYADGAPAPVNVQLQDPDGEAVDAKIRQSQAYFGDFPLARRDITLAFSIAQQGTCFFCDRAQLAAPVPVRFGEGEVTESVAVEFAAKDPGVDFLQKVNLPAVYKVTVQKTSPDPDSASGDDVHLERPQIITATSAGPFSETDGESISYSEHDATDHLLIGGSARFTIAVFMATGDLRKVLSAKRRDSGQTIGVYSADGTVFAVAASDWTPIAVGLQAKTAEGDMRYTVYAGSSNEDPGAPFLIWLAGRSSVTASPDGAPLASDALIRRLAFVQKAFGAKLSAENLDFIADPEAKVDAERLGEALGKVAVQ
jgi:hypothetical protein